MKVHGSSMNQGTTTWAPLNISFNLPPPQTKFILIVPLTSQYSIQHLHMMSATAGLNIISRNGAGGGGGSLIFVRPKHENDQSNMTNGQAAEAKPSSGLHLSPALLSLALSVQPLCQTVSRTSG